MRTVLVLDENQQTRNHFLQRSQPFPVCPIRSMISPRLSGRPAVRNFPRNAVERESLVGVIRKLDRTRHLVGQFRFHVDQMQPLDFFEYIVKCRLEYNPDFVFEFTRTIPVTSL